VICLGDNGEGHGAILIKTIADIEKIPGSIYHSISFADALQLLSDIQQPCVLIALPCHLEGIRKFIININPKLIEKIELTIGLICGWMYSHHSIYAFAHYKKIRTKIREVSYRGDDKIGLLKIKTENRHLIYSRRSFASLSERIDYRASFSRTMNRLRCRVCEDHINVLADVAVGDAWLKRYTNEKMSIVLIRNKKGESAINDLIATGKVIFVNGNTEDILESQSEDLVCGRSAKVMKDYLARKKIITPKFSFGDDYKPVLQWFHRFLFNYELLMRGIVKESKYGLYRIAFLIYKWPITIILSVWMRVHRKIGV
jgi:coenzyme F420-reducing hydrogenase beta subunit